MPGVTDPNLTWLASVAGAVVAVMIVVAVIKRAWQPTDVQAARWLPLIALVVGVAVVLFADFGLGLFGRQDIVQGVFTGIFAGASSSGIYDAVNGNT